MAKMQCLVIMPFQSEFDAVFEVVRRAVSSAIPGAFDCYWLKEVHAAGRITDDILDGLDNSTLCIADITGNNSNVMWETGYAMALGKPTILIGRSVEALPFDLRDHRVIEYRIDKLDELAGRLEEATRQTLAKYETANRPQFDSESAANSTIMAVTGTMRASRARIERRIGTLLRPYLSSDAVWYCGSNGTVDECTLAYLVAKKQRAVAVGYHRYDLSEAVRQLVQDGRVEFADASLESLPRGLTGPSERDALFSMKADLVVLLWDGQSKGTEALIRYYESSAKNLLIGFI